MSELRTVTPSDAASFENIGTFALEILSETAGRLAASGREDDLWLPRTLDDGTYSVKGFCDYASDAVTVSAHGLGFSATRQFAPGHFTTSFASPEVEPSEEDIIGCLTWGQFIAHEYDQLYDPTVQSVEPYFGPRGALREKVGSRAYAKYYAPSAISVVQTCYRASQNDPMGRDWLITSPKLQRDYNIPMGAVEQTQAGMWESELPKPQLLLRIGVAGILADIEREAMLSQATR